MMNKREMIIDITDNFQKLLWQVGTDKLCIVYPSFYEFLIRQNLIEGVKPEDVLLDEQRGIKKPCICLPGFTPERNVTIIRNNNS